MRTIFMKAITDNYNSTKQPSLPATGNIDKEFALRWELVCIILRELQCTNPEFNCRQEFMSVFCQIKKTICVCFNLTKHASHLASFFQTNAAMCRQGNGTSWHTRQNDAYRFIFKTKIWLWYHPVRVCLTPNSQTDSKLVWTPYHLRSCNQQHQQAAVRTYEVGQALTLLIVLP